MTNRAIDDLVYVREHYRTREHLALRIRTHELYTKPKINFQEVVLDLLDWAGDEIVIDVGCGSGTYVEPAARRARHYVAGDLSLGMLGGLGQRVTNRVNLDVQRLPFAEASADVILANHMLYHVPDKETALHQIWRTLKPGGRLIATTNSRVNMSELAILRKQIFESYGVSEASDKTGTLSFHLEDGQRWLERFFSQVERHDLPSALVFTDPEPVLAYIGSTKRYYEPVMSNGVGWEEIADQLRRLISQRIKREGAYRVSKLAGVFVGYKAI